MYRKIRVGRYTASLFITIVGVLVLTDQWSTREYMLQLLKWWPLVFVAWGLEYLLFFWVYYRREGKPVGGRRFRPDIKGIGCSFVLAAAVFIVTQQNHYMYLWNRVSLNLTTASMDFSQAEGNRMDKGNVLIPVSMQTSGLLVESVNGDITLKRGPVSNVEVHATMWIDEASAAESKSIADASTLTTTDGKTIQIRPEVQGYGQSGRRQPRTNMLIILPEDRRLNMEIRTSNGNVILNGVDAIDSIKVESGNGNISVSDAIGNVKGITLNGTVNIQQITGNVDMRTNRGDMQAGYISGTVALNTLVGSIRVAHSTGDISVDTKNGNIDILDAEAKLSANSLNGGITVTSALIGEDWNIYSAVGDIILDLPSNGDFQLDGSSGYGNLKADFPFTIESKSITGQNGAGDHKIKVEGNSDLTILKTEAAMLPDPDMTTVPETNRTTDTDVPR